MVGDKSLIIVPSAILHPPWRPIGASSTDPWEQLPNLLEGLTGTISTTARPVKTPGPTAGLRAGDVKIAGGSHAGVNKAVLSDAAYLARFKVKANPSPSLIRDLKKAGVEVFVCGQSLHELRCRADSGR